MKYVVNLTSSNITLAKTQLSPKNLVIMQDSKYASDETKANELLTAKSIGVADNSTDGYSICSFARQSTSYTKEDIDSTISYNTCVNNISDVDTNTTTVTNMKSNSAVANAFDLDGMLTSLSNKRAKLVELKTTNNDTYLEDAKTFKCNEITSARDTAIDAGVTYKEHLFQSAEKDRNLLTSTISLYQLQGSVPEGFTWIAADNTQVEMTLDELVELGSLMATQVSENTYKARTLKDSVNAMTSVTEIEAVTYV